MKTAQVQIRRDLSLASMGVHLFCIFIIFVNGLWTVIISQIKRIRKSRHLFLQTHGCNIKIIDSWEDTKSE
jgi:hypothetical protein